MRSDGPEVWSLLDRALPQNGVPRRRLYQQRISASAGGFSASPIAAAGRIYLTSEDGDVFVVRAGPKFELLATNKLGEITMATPAVSGSMLIVRARSGFIGVREGGRTPK